MRPEHASSAHRVATRLRRLSVERGSAQRPGLFLFIAFLLPASWLLMKKRRGIEADARAGHSLGLPALGSSAWWTVAVPAVTRHWLTHRSSLYRPDTDAEPGANVIFPAHRHLGLVRLAFPVRVHYFRLGRRTQRRFRAWSLHLVAQDHTERSSLTDEAGLRHRW